MTLRVPSVRPALLPAQLMSWQGKPAVITSTAGTRDQSVTVMSPRLAATGNRAARMAAACRSFSATQASRPPRTDRTAMSRPPYPEHSEPITGPGWQMRDGGVPAGGIGTLAGRAVRDAMVSSRVR
jgi:hypothetical protein